MSKKCAQEVSFDFFRGMHMNTLQVFACVSDMLTHCQLRVVLHGFLAIYVNILQLIIHVDSVLFYRIIQNIPLSYVHVKGKRCARVLDCTVVTPARAAAAAPL